MGRRFNAVLAAFATVVGSVALVRLADAVGKRELTRAAKEVAADAQAVQAQHDSLAGVRSKLAADIEFLNYRIASLSKREPYLVIDRSERKLTIVVQDKTILETRYRLRLMTDGLDEYTALPKATLEVLGKKDTSDWFKPDWLYKLEGVELPADSAARKVKNAFGAGQVFLGADLEIHGRVSDEVPDEAIDHNYLEVDSLPLRAVLEAVKQGSLVLIR
jgi:hypothetical protein